MFFKLCFINIYNMKSQFILIFIIPLFLISGCLDGECGTSNDCATKTCFTAECRNKNCFYSLVPNCCGNDRCELGETYENCSVDCPSCDDGNKCTEDGYDYHEFYSNCLNGPDPKPGWCDANDDGSINSDDMKNIGLMDCMSCN